MKNIKLLAILQPGKEKIKRNRIIYAAIIAAVITAGLLSRKYGYALPHLVSAYAGDILWALMVFLMTGFVFRTLSPIKTAFYSGIISFFIEVSQLYHAPWIDSIRRTVLGALVLGFGFLWSDLLCYLIGIMIGLTIEISFAVRLRG